MSTNDKDKMRGCDYRLLLLVVYHAMTKIQCRPHVIAILETLAEISHIAYSTYEFRNQKNVLRLSNICYWHHELMRTYFESPKKLTRDKMHGIYPHVMLLHYPKEYRKTCLRSLVEEANEKMFTDLKDIARKTSNRQGQHVIDNGLVRFQQEALSRDMSKQNDVTNKISRLGSTLPRANTKFPLSMMTSESFQCHLESIPDYLLADGWWKLTEDGIEFFDGANESDSREGPIMHHFRSSTTKDILLYLNDCWKQLLLEPSRIPLSKIRIYDEKGQFVRTLKQSFPVHSTSSLEEEEALTDQPLPSASSTYTPIQEECEEPDSNVVDIEFHVSSKFDLLDTDDTLHSLPPSNVAPPTTPNNDATINCTSNTNNQTPKNIPKREYSSTLCRKLAQVLDLGANMSLRIFDKLRVQMRSSASSERVFKDYKTVEAKIQTMVLSRHRELEKKIKDWEQSYVVNELREPSIEDYDAETSEYYEHMVICKKLLRDWNIQFV